MSDWRWPGSRWWRFDLHTHSPASYDFGTQQDRAQPDWPRWLEAARDAGLHAVAVTDHNTAAGVAALQQAASAVPNAPVVFPAVELTANDGTHLLLVLGPDCTQRHVEEILALARVPVDQQGRHEATSPLSVEQLFELRCDRGLLILGAHVNMPKGLLEHEGQQRIKELRDPRLCGVEIDPDHGCDMSWLDGSRTEIARALPAVWASDSHGFNQAGRRFTWVKVTTPDLEGLRLALHDGDGSLVPARAAAPGDPNRHAPYAIESITVHKAVYIGRPAAFTVTFNPWLNSMIGGRGTGKSTLVDLCRATLRRGNELAAEGETSLRAAFDRRMRVPAHRSDEGLLTTETAVEVVYRKDGQRFAIGWSQDGRAHPIARLDGDVRVPEEGEIRDRFPVRIYSQKQLFELARTPNALLTVIDDANQVRGAEIERAMREAEAKYLALCAEARALHAQAADLPARRATLADVRRKIELLQSGSHAAVLTAYRERRAQDATWSTAHGSAHEGIAAIERAVDGLSVPDSTMPGDSTDPALAALARAHEQIQTIVAEMHDAVRATVDRARQRLTAVAEGQDLETWRAALAVAEEEYRQVGEELAAAGIASADEYRDLLQEAATVEQQIAGLEQTRTAAEQREALAVETLARRRELRAELSERRIAFARSTSGAVIRVEIRDLTDRSGFEAYLRTSLEIGRFDEDHRAIVSRGVPDPAAAWSYAALDAIVREMRQLAADPERHWDSADRRFETALRRLPPERIDRFALYVPSDLVEVSFRDPRDATQQWRRLAQGSPGQQTAALLAFVLGYGTEPIILDQPEDDLDNTLIYELLVQKLRESKQTRQIIVVTHNANIVVHGDAELVVSLHALNGQTQVHVTGGLQEHAVRGEVCRVMEGGPDAFERRYRRIMHRGTS